MSPLKLSLAGLLLLFALQSMTSTTERTTSRSTWNVTFQPYAGKGEAAMPVPVTTFDVLNHQGGMWVREWRVKNRTTKLVRRMRHAWFVVNEQEPEKVLVRTGVARYFGLTLGPERDWPLSKCPPEAKSCQSAFATFSLDELMESLKLEDHNAKYRVSLGIDKVWFDDGTTWEFNTQ